MENKYYVEKLDSFLYINGLYKKTGSNYIETSSNKFIVTGSYIYNINPGDIFTLLNVTSHIFALGDDYDKAEIYFKGKVVYANIANGVQINNWLNVELL